MLSLVLAALVQAPAPGAYSAETRAVRASAYFPFYLRNLNSGADNEELETKAVAARQKIFHAAARPSRVILPILKR